MNLTYKFLIFFITLSFFCSVISGQEILLETVAPDIVRSGDEFYVKYRINRKASDIKLDKAVSDLRLVSGPSQSMSSSLSIVNGVTTKTEQTTFVYTIVAENTGTYALPIASVTAESIKYLSDTIYVKVQARDSLATEESVFSSDSLFVKLLFSKNEAFKQESVTAQLKLFSKVEVSSLEEVVLPSFKEFLIYDLDPQQELKMAKDTIDGEIFNSVVLKSLLLLPVKSGNFKPGAAKISCTVRKPKTNKTSDLFEDFFASYSTEKVSIYSDSGNIYVKDFPEEIPEDFTNICGSNLKISVTLDKSKITVNEPFVFEATVSGSGNLKLISTPDIKFPINLKLIKSEYNNNLTTDSAGISGQRNFLYKIVPVSQGEYSIPSFSLSYFNPETNEYRQVSSPEVIINAEGTGKDYQVQKISNQLKEEKRKKKKGIESASIVVLDMSDSMLAQDFEPNRKKAVIEELSGYLKYTKHDTRLVLYSAVPYLFASNRNGNKAVIDSLLNNIDIKLGDGTATGYGILLATDELRKIDARDKRIILITDGDSNSGSINELLASEIAAFLGIKINIIGISANAESAPITVETIFGEQKTNIPITIDDKELSEVAGLTGGRYFRATDSVSLRNSLKEMNSVVRHKLVDNKSKMTFTESEVNSLFNVMYQDISEKNSEIEAIQN